MVTLEPEKSSGKMLVGFSLLIRPDDYAKGSLLTMFVDVDAFIKPMVYQGTGLGATGEIVLVNREAQLLVPLKHPLKGGTEAKILETKISASPALRAAAGENVTFLSKDYRGKSVFAAARSIPITPDAYWGMVVKRDVADVRGHALKGFLYSLIATLFCLLGGGALAFVVARRIARPLEDLCETAEKIESGDLNARVEAKGSREIITLTKTFNRMMERLRVWQDELEIQVKARPSDLNQEISIRKQAEAELGREKDQLRVTLRSIGDGVISTDTEGKVLSVNFAAEQLTGWSEEEAKGRPLHEVFSIINEETRQPCKNPVDKVLSTGVVVGLANHTALISRDGTERVIADSGSPIKDSDGHVVGVVLVFRDVTEQTRAYDRFQKEKDFTDLTLESLPGIFYLVNEDMRFVRSNKTLETITGYCAEEVRDLCALDLFQGSNRSIIKEGINEVFSTGQANREAFLLTKDGREIPFLFTGKKVLLDEKPHLVGLGIDIADRLKAQEALVRSEERYRNLFESAQVGISITSPEGKIVATNQTFLDTFGYSRDEIRKIRASDLYFNPADRSKFQEAIERDGWVKDFLVKVKTKEDTSRDMVVTSTVFRDPDGTIVAYQNVHQDVTEQKRTQDALLFERAQLLSIFGSINQLIHVSDVETYEVLYANSFCKKVLEQDPLGQKCYKVFHGKESRCEFCPYEKIHNLKGEPYEWEFHLENPPKDLMITDRLIKWPDGRTVKFELAIDITDRKSAEEKIRKNEILLKQVLEMLPVGVWIIDETGTIQHGNPAGQTVWGGSRFVSVNEYNEYKGWWHDSGKRIEPEDWAAARAIRQGETSIEEVIDIESFDGKRKVILNSALPIRNELGMITGAVVVNQDITDRIEAEHALRSSEQMMRVLIESSPIGLTVMDGHQYIFANQAFAKMFNYSDPKEIAGMPLESLLPPEERALLARRARDRIAGKPVPSHYETRAQKKNGQIFDVGVWATTVQYEGHTRDLVFVTDISESKMLREQLLQSQKMEAIGTLAGGIAHDFNNLLTATSGYSELLLMKKRPDDPDYEPLQRIAHASDKAAELTKSLLAFSRKTETKFHPIELNQEIKSMVKLLTRTIPKSVNIQMYLSDDVKVINADSGQIGQVLMNLGINAGHAMPDGGTLTIETERVVIDPEHCHNWPGLNPGTYALLSVSDTGAGIEKQNLAHIFEPFFTSKGPGEGTGLGLAVVYGIVKGHGGYIACDSEINQGTVFKVFLPFPEELPLEHTDQESPQVPKGGTETILLVDDEEPIIYFGRQILENAGYTVLTARDGKRALEVYKAGGNNISLIVLDLNMPVMGGIKCLEEILLVNPDASIVVCTGYAGAPQAHEAIKCGARAFLEKPFKSRDMLQTLRNVLDGRLT